jgi:hypothetical protein
MKVLSISLVALVLAGPAMAAGCPRPADWRATLTASTPHPTRCAPAPLRAVRGDQPARTKPDAGSTFRVGNTEVTVGGHISVDVTTGYAPRR